MLPPVKDAGDVGLGPPGDVKAKPGEFQNEGEEPNIKSACMELTIKVDGKDQTFYFRVHFPAKTNSDGREAILAKFPKDTAEALLKHSMGLGLGTTFQKISMAYDKDSKISEIKGHVKENEEGKEISEFYNHRIKELKSPEEVKKRQKRLRRIY